MAYFISVIKSETKN